MNPSHSPCLLVFAAMECDGPECGDDFCVVGFAKLGWDAVGLMIACTAADLFEILRSIWKRNVFLPF